MSVEHHRAKILNRVAEGIWNTEPTGRLLPWGRALVASQHPDEEDLAHAVKKTQAKARAAIAALRIGVNTRPEDEHLAMAGEHASGIVGGLCVDIFDAMLTEVLE